MTHALFPARLPSRFTTDAPLMARTAAALALLAIPLTLALLFDPRSLDGENLWLKPLKFAVALALYAGTLTWAARLLPLPVRAAGWMRTYSRIVVACIAIEQIWITGAAAFGLRSHYNDAQPLMVAIYPLMGVTAVVLTSAAAVWGWHILRQAWSEIDRAIGWSFLATFALTVPIAATLSQAPVTAAGLPPFGWTLQPGDLRPAHFLATHTMQVVPLTALALAQLRTLPYGTGAVLTGLWACVTLAAAAYGLGWL